jgi:hypothetical protein
MRFESCNLSTSVLLTSMMRRELYCEESDGTPLVMAKPHLYDPLLASHTATSLVALQLSRVGGNHIRTSLSGLQRCTNLAALDLSHCRGLQDDALLSILQGEAMTGQSDVWVVS